MAKNVFEILLYRIKREEFYLKYRNALNIKLSEFYTEKDPNALNFEDLFLNLWRALGIQSGNRRN